MSYSNSCIEDKDMQIRTTFESTCMSIPLVLGRTTDGDVIKMLQGIHLKCIKSNHLTLNFDFGGLIACFQPPLNFG